MKNRGQNSVEINRYVIVRIGWPCESLTFAPAMLKWINDLPVAAFLLRQR